LIIAVVGGWRGYPILIAFYFVDLTLALVDLTPALPDENRDRLPKERVLYPFGKS
jgi:hypothetical protein